MAFSATVLGSGSSGNATLLRHSRGCVLLDCGLSGKETCRRLLTLGVDPESLSGIIVSHEHHDHTQSLRVLSRRFKIPVYISDLTLDTLSYSRELRQRERIEGGCRFEVAGMVFLPFTISHDSVDPLAFVVSAEGQRLGIAMDLGYISGLVRQRLSGCDGLILESNHDLEMLKLGPYPWALKQRVMSRQGHLSNDAVARFLTADLDGRARFLFLAHLSRNNNHPDLARLSAQKALQERESGTDVISTRVKITYQDRPSDVMHLD